MATNAEPLSAKVQDSFRQLTAAAANLNAVSDELGKPIAELEEALKKLSLGVVVWARMESDHEPDGGGWWTRDIGYAKINGKWGISLRSRSGDEEYPERDREEAWQFNEAPRWMRVKGIEHIPTLLDQMVLETNGAAEKLRAKISEASEIVGAVRASVPAPVGKKK